MNPADFGIPNVKADKIKPIDQILAAAQEHGWAVAPVGWRNSITLIEPGQDDDLPPHLLRRLTVHFNRANGTVTSARGPGRHVDLGGAGKLAKVLAYLAEPNKETRAADSIGPGAVIGDQMVTHVGPVGEYLHIGLTDGTTFARKPDETVPNPLPVTRRARLVYEVTVAARRLRDAEAALDAHLDEEV